MPSEAARSVDGRVRAHALLQDPNLSIGAIARRLGVSRRTVEHWNLRDGVRLPQPRRRTLEEWPQARREAAMRLLSVEIDPGDLAEAAGFARAAAPVLLAAFGPPGRTAAGGDRVDPRRLRERLRAHIGRQIAVLDAALSDAPQAGFDSAKVLRDLGGLKRLLDDLGSGADGAGEGEPHDEPARSGPDGADLDGLRAEIARRFDRFVGGGAAG
ncbi:hypothetical protein [Methylobacterium sp. J-076]|uniref:hypothetical protein n=1 Tax=Methylobacterium sp. J-076 TaxID=2836655 RepID=UPI001FBADCA1|nr:hypothetical protein [Methylobacterium sp. J-076]MCJ2012067.1 hypothetical protein [Methylobacterium sp. J-076]